ncbi:linoleate diol synthase [Rhexocercosporidium sp. MPI-PUGE-AT-0058]|nr:linoleate diol synthase [Rhexocercosporidium sp. MPI-PUGE-AT-0058]
MAPTNLKSIIGTLRRKPTRAPDGKTDAEAAPTQISEKTSIGHDILTMGLKNTATVAQAITTLASGEPMDDKELLLENGVAMLQSLPLNSGLSEKISNDFIAMLWHDLPHPPPTLAGPTARYRKHDGSCNNPWAPEMGKAGAPYSRSVPPLKNQGPNLPDPELVFDQLLKRNGTFRPHPSGLNRLFFSFATIVIHECFQTSRENPWINETSSYVDLSTIYGNTEREQERVRTRENGTIFPDSIASERIMMMPPGVIAVLLMFSRNHNHIAANMLTVNEDGKYKPWESLDEKQRKWQDEDIFQISRNINVGYFAAVVLRDYVAAILNTPRSNSTWSLDLGKEIKQFGKRVERGTGNVVSVEFAVLYHWHAALSAADDKWMEYVLKDALPDLKSVDDMTTEKFLHVMKTKGHQLMSKPAREWTFGGLQRGPDGSFSDYDLAEILKNCVEEPAHAFGAHGTPASLKIVDIMGQLQARDVFNVCTMNEFRRYLNLKPYESFEDWNPEKETARAAELLYGHIDNLELYPGLMAECTKPAMPGSGVCPGQTTGRGILDDAVALVRGDRFLSYDFNSSTLTNWGFAKLGQTVPGAYGGVLPYLLFNGLPGAWTGTSSYALLPFYTPSAAKGILKQNKVLERYDFERPASDMEVIGIHTHDGCKRVFEDRENFRVMYQKAIRNCTDGHDFMIGWDDAKRHDERSSILHKVMFEEKFEAKMSLFFKTNVARLIKDNSLKYSNSTRRSIDIVRDVTNVTPILWLAERFAIPLKTAKYPHGLIPIPDAFKAYLVLFMYQSFNIIPANEWALREGGIQAGEALRKIFTAHLKTQQGFKEGIVDWLAKGSAFEVNPEADRLYHALNNSKLPIGDLVGDCIGMGAPVAGNLTQQASLLIDLYLSEGYEEYKARIVELANMDDEASERELQGFVFEGMRHAGVVPGLPRVASKDITFIDGVRGPINIKAGHTILIATSKAAMDPIQFPNPEKLDPHRPFKDYILLGHGMHFCYGARMVGCSLAATLREVFKLKNIRRAPGRQGHFTIVEHEFAGVKMRKYLDANAVESPIPTTLTLEYDE